VADSGQLEYKSTTQHVFSLWHKSSPAICLLIRYRLLLKAATGHIDTSHVDQSIRMLGQTDFRDLDSGSIVSGLWNRNERTNV